MDSVLVWPLAVVASMTVVAVAAVLLARFALRGTASEHRAAVLGAVADVVRAVRGRR
ncbi:hypothetical protein [Streptomyces longisporus]